MSMISSLFIVCKIHGRKFMTSCDTVLLLIFVQKKIYSEGNSANHLSPLDDFTLYKLFDTQLASCSFKRTNSVGKQTRYTQIRHWEWV